MIDLIHNFPPRRLKLNFPKPRLKIQILPKCCLSNKFQSSKAVKHSRNLFSPSKYQNAIVVVKY